MTRSATAEIAAFVADADLADVPAEVVALAREHAIDGTAVMLAGGTEEATRIVREHVESLGARGVASVVGTRLRSGAAAAALANGTSAHAHDFDDTQVSASPDRIYGLMTHPTASVWAATLAAAEQAGASGGETLLAYLLGLEVACRLCDAISPFHTVRGFHTTATMGVFGATAAAGRLLRLDAARIRHALGIAASASAGLRINFGTMVKPLHAGRAAEAGVVAAQLAGRGLTAREDALEGPGGFFKTLASDLRPDDPALVANPLWGYRDAGSPGFDAERIAGRLGRPWWIASPGISIKPFPSVVLSHPSMLALLDLLVAHDVRPERIGRIRVHAGPTVRHILYLAPTTGTQGKFSLTYCLASIALRRRAGLDDFTDALVNADDARAMMGRVELVADEAIGRAGFAAIASRVELVLDDGTVLVKEAEPYRGGRDNPMPPAQLRAKFVDCAARVIGRDGSERALAQLERIERLDGIEQLTRELAPG